MKNLIIVALVASLTCLVATSDGQAQQFVPPGAYYANSWSSWYPYPAQRSVWAFRSPYGYSTATRVTSVPSYYGPTAFANTQTFVQPYVSSLTHSVYFDPFANTYRYTPSFTPTPLPAPTWVNPYLP